MKKETNTLTQNQTYTFDASKNASYAYNIVLPKRTRQEIVNFFNRFEQKPKRCSLDGDMRGFRQNLIKTFGLDHQFSTIILHDDLTGAYEY